MNIKQLMEAFASKSAEVDKLLAKGGEITGEDFAQIKKLNSEIEGLSGQIEGAQKEEKELSAIREASANRMKQLSDVKTPAHQGAPVQTPNVHGFQKDSDAYLERKEDGTLELLFSGAGQFTKKQIETICSKEYEDAFRVYLKVGQHSLMPLAEAKTLQEGTDSAGGFTVPEQILRRLLQKDPTPTRIAGKVSRLTTSRDSLTIPRVVYNTDDIYTTGMRAVFTGEQPAGSSAHRQGTASGTSEAVFGQMRIPVWTVMMSAGLTNDVIEDSMFGLSAWLASKISETRDLLYDNMVINGSGVNQPEGIIGDASQFPISGIGDYAQYINVGSPINADGLLSLAWGVPEQYEDNLSWVMSKTSTGQAIAKLKDAANRYIWGMGNQDSGLEVSLRRALCGYPVAFSGFMPANTATYPLILGDLRGYSIVERVGLSVQVLNEIYAEQNQKVLLGRMRFGGGMTEPWRIKVGKKA